MKLHYVGCYLDDIIIASVGKDSHLELVDKILTILDKCGLTLTAKKVKLPENSIEFLGYLIKDGKRFPTDEKVDTIKNWKLPTPMKDWYKFIGFVNFLSAFIPDCALLLKPLYEHHSCLKSKTISTVEEGVSYRNFALIKEALINSTGLQLFNPNETLFIYTDASDLGAGGIFLQKWEKDQTKLIPIAFYSKSFTTTQQKYSTLERELLGIIMALTHNYLLL
ncbi:hypothetical protein DAPK24_039680 [Pichia kluyveri]|uniref:Reverse transcriptase domain-containing protein n=1 Tax=Pichia kluyveri TaxID=36015 RepID=A0AAV5R843_PICKL|nr:hypothetical protein DAPK24_039680 [Pichia kluyveri]